MKSIRKLSMVLVDGDNKLLSDSFFNLVSKNSNIENFIRVGEISGKSHNVRISMQVPAYVPYSLSIVSSEKWKNNNLCREITGFAIPLETDYDYSHNLAEGVNARASICSEEVDRLSNDKSKVYACCRIVKFYHVEVDLTYVYIFWSWKYE